MCDGRGAGLVDRLSDTVAIPDTLGRTDVLVISLVMAWRRRRRATT